MKDLQNSPYLTVMADKTTDSSNREEVILIIWWVTEDLEVHEEFLGLYHVEKIDSNTLTSVIKDVMIRANLSLEKLHGQCFDGASSSSMSGSKQVLQSKLVTLSQEQCLLTVMVMLLIRLQVIL